MILIILLGMFCYILWKYKPINFLKELEDFKVEIEEASSPGRENTIKYYYMDKIDSLIDINNIKRAELLLDSLLEIKFKNAEEWYFRKGKILYLKNNFSLAIEYFSRTIEHSHRNYVLAYLWRSYAYAKVGIVLLLLKI